MTESDEDKQPPEGVMAIMKRDVLGRVLTTAEQREVLLEEFGRSGLSGPQFARVAGINYQTLATWRQARTRQCLQNKANTSQEGQEGREVKRSKMEAPPFHFAQVMVQASAPELRSTGAVALRVQLRDGVHLEIRDAREVALAVQLIRGLAPSC